MLTNNQNEKAIIVDANTCKIILRHVKLFMPLSGSYSKDFYLIKSDDSIIIEPLEGLGSSEDLIKVLSGK